MNTLGRIGRMGEAWGRGFRTRLKTVGRYLNRSEFAEPPVFLQPVLGTQVALDRAGYVRN